MTARDVVRTSQPPRWGLASVGAVGIVVAAVLAAYARVSPGDGAAITTLGFSTLLAMKAWLSSILIVLVAVQVVSALAMWGRLPGVSAAPAWVSPLHRWTGTVAFVVSLPVAFHCVWSLGFSDSSARTLIHSLVGCLVYGIFAAKMLALRLPGLPGWTLPVLGGALAVALTVVWFTSALWFFTVSGAPAY